MYHVLENSVISNTRYIEIRPLTIAYCQARWGICSIQSQQCAKAWDAVGVGGAYPCGEAGAVSGPRTQENAALVFPNPSLGRYQILFKTIAKRELFLRSTLSGHCLQQFQNHTEDAEIDLSSYPAGIYFLEIRSHNDSEVIKLVKQ